jgi:ABC-2 type transport system permease protein
MTVIQNAFANSSSSIVSAKVQGNIVDTLMPPLSPLELVVGYIAGGVARGLLVAVAIGLGMIVFIGTGLAHPIWALVFVLLGSAFMAGLGILASVFANKFDQMAAITNFVITPLAFLSGTFYSITFLPPILELACRFNPFFYIIDGVRFGVLGVSDSSPWLGLVVSLGSLAVVMGICHNWFRRGYRLKP